MTKKPFGAFRRTIPAEGISKAYLIAFLSLLVECAGTFLLCILEPHTAFLPLIFEVTSAFGTVGLSTGITPGLCDISKLILVLIMFIGRLGAFTIASMWVCRPAPTARFTEESITIG